MWVQRRCQFPAEKRQVLHPYLALFLIISFLNIWDSGQSKVGAIRIFPQHLVAAEEGIQTNMEGSPSPPPPPGPPPGNSQTEFFREYLNARLSDLNSTRNGTFLDYKRRIPNCPDPLHN